MSDLDLERQKQRGIRAKQLLDDPLMVNAFADIRNLMYSKIQSSEFNQLNEREECYRMLRTMEAFEGIFKRHINTGKTAQEKLTLAQRVVKRISEY